MPQVRPAKPRDTALQERLRAIAALQAQQKAAVASTECQRRGKRKVTTLPGLLTFKNMRLQVPCTISDMSVTGARLSLPAGTAQTFGDLEHLPDRVVLVMRADRMQVECEVKWRRANGIGVRFMGPPVPIAKK